MKNRNLAKEARRILRLRRVGAKVRGTAARPRLVVFRSLKHVSAQIINDQSAQTLAAAHDREVDTALRGVERAAAVGKLVAERARKVGVNQVVFDRRSYRYHGQVRALAEAARTVGLNF